MSVEAMRQALDALNTTNTHPISSNEQYEKEMRAMEALEDAIDDAEERQWVGLTDEEILDLADEHLYNGGKARDFIYHAHDIEAKLKEKNHA